MGYFVLFVVAGVILFMILKRSLKNLPQVKQASGTLSKNEIRMADNILIPIQGVTEEVKSKLKLMILSSNAAGVADIERKTRSLLDDFEWPEFDEWRKRFKEIEYWPYMWGSIGVYFELQDAPTDTLLSELTKDQLQRLATEYAVPTKKSYTKTRVLDSLATAVLTLDRNKVLEIVNKEWRSRYLREKRTLLIHSVLFRSNVKERINRIKDPDTISIIKHIEISTIDDCPICKEKSKNKFHPTSIMKNDLPPFHPGCRCLEVMETKYS